MKTSHTKSKIHLTNDKRQALYEELLMKSNQGKISNDFMKESERGPRRRACQHEAPKRQLRPKGNLYTS
ncbi:unnamed protein product [Aphanomyces euteiches]